MESLIDKVLDQIVADVESGDLTAIELLLLNVNDNDLFAFLRGE